MYVGRVMAARPAISPEAISLAQDLQPDLFYAPNAWDTVLQATPATDRTP